MFDVKDKQETSLGKDPVIANMATYDHEQLLFCQDKATGLRAIIAIHNTVLGPSLGGTRMWTYRNELEAINDVLRLSRGMSYKAAISGLNLGGGKAVIIGDSRKHKSEALFRRFGRFVDSLGGKYITAEDVGISPQDIRYMAMETEHVAGKPESMGGGGDPSPVTAYGVYVGMKASAKQAYGSDSLEGKRIMVQGVGHVGTYLVEYLTKEGAKVLVSDIHEDNLTNVVNKYGATVVGLDNVYTTPMDIYAPCALGATVNDDTIDIMNCSIIAGAANNQLADEVKHGKILMDKGVIYAPDYLINAGGLINCYSEVIGYNRDEAMVGTENIYRTTLDIIKKANEEQIPTYLAANRMAEARIEAIGKVKLSH
jgi:leucine dehydrogenase